MEHAGVAPPRRSQRHHGERTCGIGFSGNAALGLEDCDMVIGESGSLAEFRFYLALRRRTAMLDGVAENKADNTVACLVAQGWWLLHDC